MLTLLCLLFAFLIMAYAGKLLLEIPLLKLAEEPLGARVPVYLMAGSIVISLYMFILFLLNVRFSVISIGCPFTIYMVYCFYRDRHAIPGMLSGQIEHLKALSRSAMDRSNWIFILAASLLSLVVLTIFTQNFIIPTYIGDTLTMWFFKPKAIFINKTIPHIFFTEVNFAFNQPSYPLLSSLNLAWIAVCMGKWTDPVVRTFYSVLYLASAVFFYTSLKRAVNKDIAIIGTFITFTIPHIVGDITTGYVDLIVGFYGLFAAVYLLKWFDEPKKNRYLYLSALMAGGAAWTHNQGLMLFAAFLLSLTAYLLVNLISGKIKLLVSTIDLAVFIAIFYSVIGLFKVFLKHNQIKTIWVSSFSQLFLVLPNLWRLPIIISYLFYELFLDTYLWMYFWIFMILFLALNRAEVARTNLKYLLLFVLLSFVMIIEVFLVSTGFDTPENLVHIIGQNLDRAMLIVVPAAGYLMFASFNDRKKA